MKRKTVVLFLIAALAVGLVLSADGLSVQGNGRKLQQSIQNAESGTVLLNDLVPFSWDSLYIIQEPYLSQGQIEEIIGFQSPHIRETPSEGMVQLLFTRGSRIVCSVCGYADRLGYYFDAPPNGGYAKIAYADGARFSLSREKKLAVLVLL